MFKIKKNGVVANIGPDQEWLDKHIEMGTFGKPEHSIFHEISPAEFDEEGEMIHEAVLEEEIIPSEFEVEFVPDDFKEQDQINAESLQFLSETDWYVTRFVETGIDIPQDIKDQRQEARSKVVQ